MTNIASQTWLAERYATAGAFVPVLGVPVLDLLDPQPGERVLDLGCGDGVLTEKIASVIVALTAVLARRGIEAGRRNPFYFPTAEAYRAKLETAGFTVDEIGIIPRPTVLATGIEPRLDAFCEAFLAAVPAPQRPR